MKRLIAISDGLWTSRTLPGNSNLGLLTRALTSQADNGVLQLAFTDPYQSLADVQPCGRRVSLLKESICALYQQIALNYSPGDLLWFFGYGRGSFVVRACIGMIRNVGVLKRSHLDKLPEAWHIYQTTWGADANNAIHFRRTCSYLTDIKFLGVFDTLGQLGVPPPLTSEVTDNTIRFHDTRLTNAIDYACHALAIDEWRKGYQACVWRTHPDRCQTEQCWFTGNHRDIGGIHGDAALSNIALRWMVSRSNALGLAFNEGLLSSAMAQRQRDNQSLEDYESGQVKKTGTKSRPIGNGNSDETLHPSAEQRYLRNHSYRPSNLRTYMQRDDQIQLPL